MIWPKRPGSWIYGAKKAREVFAQIAAAINESEQLYMLVSKEQLDNARSLLPESIHIIEMVQMCMAKRYMPYIRCKR